MSMKIFGVIFSVLIINANFAFSSNQTCGDYDGTNYSVSSSNIGLPSKKVRMDEARTIFSKIKLFASEISNCSIYAHKKSILESIFDEVERHYARAAGDGNEYHYKCLKKIEEIYALTGYAAVTYYENDSSYQSINPPVSKMKTGKDFDFKQCDAPKKVLTPVGGVINPGNPSSNAIPTTYECPLELQITKVGNISGFPKVVEPTVEFKKIREKKIFGKWNYFCLYTNDSIPLLHMNSNSTQKCLTLVGGNKITCN